MLYSHHLALVFLNPSQTKLLAKSTWHVRCYNQSVCFHERACCCAWRPATRGTAAGMREAPSHHQHPCRARRLEGETGTPWCPGPGTTSPLAADRRGARGKTRRGCGAEGKWEPSVPEGGRPPAAVAAGRRRAAPGGRTGAGCGGVTAGVTVPGHRPPRRVPSFPPSREAARRDRVCGVVRYSGVRCGAGSPRPQPSLRAMPAAAPPTLHPAAGSCCPYGHCAGECPLLSISRLGGSPRAPSPAPLPGRWPAGGVFLGGGG